MLLRPNLGSIDLMNFNRTDQAIAAGRDAARAELPRLQALLGRRVGVPAVEGDPVAGGDPLLLSRQVGDGHVLLLTTALDGSWTNLPTKPLLVPLLLQSAGSTPAWLSAGPWAPDAFFGLTGWTRLGRAVGASLFVGLAVTLLASAWRRERPGRPASGGPAGAQTVVRIGHVAPYATYSRTLASG